MRIEMEKNLEDACVSQALVDAHVYLKADETKAGAMLRLTKDADITQYYWQLGNALTDEADYWKLGKALREQAKAEPLTVIESKEVTKEVLLFKEAMTAARDHWKAHEKSETMKEKTLRILKAWEVRYRHGYRGRELGFRFKATEEVQIEMEKNLEDAYVYLKADETKEEAMLRLQKAYKAAGEYVTTAYHYRSPHSLNEEDRGILQFFEKVVKASYDHWKKHEKSETMEAKLLRLSKEKEA
jgi:hypothetical protein